MKSRHSLDRAKPLVLDTSIIINLLATGYAEAILAALPPPKLITENVKWEIENGKKAGHDQTEYLEKLAGDRFVEFVVLDDHENSTFETLVRGPAISTLDDGEAATIAYAFGHAAIPVLDERKASRIWEDSFSEQRPLATVDLLLNSTVEAALGREVLGSAVFRALQDARMRVPPEYYESVVGIIGNDRAYRCSSLPKHIRVNSVRK